MLCDITYSKPYRNITRFFNNGRGVIGYLLNIDEEETFCSCTYLSLDGHLSSPLSLNSHSVMTGPLSLWAQWNRGSTLFNAECPSTETCCFRDNKLSRMCCLTRCCLTWLHCLYLFFNICNHIALLVNALRFNVWGQHRVHLNSTIVQVYGHDGRSQLEPNPHNTEDRHKKLE